MSIDRSKATAAAMLACLAIVALASSATPAAATSGAPPFCVMLGGGRWYSAPQVCRFVDYQDCLQAAAELHGNCVANIDYRGEVSMAPVPVQPRSRRHY